jgi:hypothetical protein
LGALQALHDRFCDRVAFFVVYVREAHPEDGWVLSDNRRAGITVTDPASLAERAEVASSCATRFSLDIPVLVDGVGDEVARRYGGWPDRLYLINAAGKVAYQGGPGPFGFDVSELETAIVAELA